MGAPGPGSRYAFCEAIRYDDGTVDLTRRAPFRFREIQDTRRHIVVGGETLAVLAARYFAPREDAPRLWWVIADFQPTPILDPTIALEAGAEIFVPSLRVIEEVILGERRRREHS